jgi:regulatory protein
VAAAYDRALRLLTVRARGRAELGADLERRGFSKASAQEALDWLAGQSLLDDLAAARSLVRVQSARYGRARIERELSARGFSTETIAAALAEADSSGEEKSLERAFAKLWASSAGTPRQRRRQRVWSALVRRGFAAARVSEIMKGSHDDDEIDRGP